MTTVNRVCPELADIKAIRLECVHCGASVSYPPDKWKPAYLKCPNCPAVLLAGSVSQLSPELAAVHIMAEGFREFLALQNPQFRLSLEFDQ